MPRGVPRPGHNNHRHGADHPRYILDASPHLDGRPVSYTTYKNHGCKCRGCRDAWSAKQAEYSRRHRRRKATDALFERKYRGYRNIYRPAVAAVLAHEEALAEYETGAA